MNTIEELNQSDETEYLSFKVKLLFVGIYRASLHLRGVNEHDGVLNSDTTDGQRQVVRQSLGKLKFVCEYCHKRFSYFTRLCYHYERSHDDYSIGRTMVGCRHCGRWFDNSSLLSEHRYIFHKTTNC